MARDRDRCPDCGFRGRTKTETDGIVRCEKCSLPYLIRPGRFLPADEFNELCGREGLTFRQASVLSFLIARRHTNTDPGDVARFFDNDGIHEDLAALSERGLVKNLDHWTYWAVA